MIDFFLAHLGISFIEAEHVLLVIFVLAAAAYDIKYRRIPNLLIISGIIVSLLYQTYFGIGYGFTFWIAGLGTGFILLLPLYVLRAMGAGDVKLMALVGSFLGAAGIFQTFFLILISGGLLSLLVMLWNRNWKLVFQNISLMTANMTIAAITKQLPKAEVPIKSAGNLPYGVAIAVGVLLYVVFFRP